MKRGRQSGAELPWRYRAFETVEDTPDQSACLGTRALRPDLSDPVGPAMEWIVLVRATRG